jgi:hypothetical protein
LKLIFNEQIIKKNKKTPKNPKKKPKKPKKPKKTHKKTRVFSNPGLQAAGLDQSKMYMKAMFPAGMADTKKELMEKVGFFA